MNRIKRSSLSVKRKDKCLGRLGKKLIKSRNIEDEEIGDSIDILRDGLRRKKL